MPLLIDGHNLIGVLPEIDLAKAASSAPPATLATCTPINSTSAVLSMTPSPRMRLIIGQIARPRLRQSPCSTASFPRPAPSASACAACHRAHTANHMHLLVEREDDDLGEGREGELCLACHNGLGANTNVLDGVYVPTSDPLLGGGFNNYRGLPATSRHDIHGSSPALAWGNGVNRGLLAPLTDMHLSCDSCHDPHGTGNYRNIASYINGVPVFIPRSDRDIPAERLYVAEQWGANQSTVCIACHGNYHVASPGSGSDPALLASGGFAHRNDMPYLYSFGDQTNTNPETVGWNGLTLPLAESGVTDTVVCQTCHLPHGTSAIVTDLGSAGDSALLRLDNGLVCQTCHQK